MLVNPLPAVGHVPSTFTTKITPTHSGDGDGGGGGGTHAPPFSIHPSKGFLYGEDETVSFPNFGSLCSPVF